MVAQNKGGNTTTEVQAPLPPAKRKTDPKEVAIGELPLADKQKKIWVVVDIAIDAPQSLGSLYYRCKGRAYSHGAKAMSNLVVCERLIWAMILPADYDMAINMSQEDRQQKLNHARYRVSHALLLNFLYFFKYKLLDTVVHVQVLKQAEEDDSFGVVVQLTSLKNKRDMLKMEKEKAIQDKGKATSKVEQLLKKKT